MINIIDILNIHSIDITRVITSKSKNLETMLIGMYFSKTVMCFLKVSLLILRFIANFVLMLHPKDYRVSGICR